MIKTQGFKYKLLAPALFVLDQTSFSGLEQEAPNCAVRGDKVLWNSCEINWIWNVCQLAKDVLISYNRGNLLVPAWLVWHTALSELKVQSTAKITITNQQTITKHFLVRYKFFCLTGSSIVDSTQWQQEQYQTEAEQ